MNKEMKTGRANMGPVPENIARFNQDDQIDWWQGVKCKTKGAFTCTHGSKQGFSSESAPYGPGTAHDTLFSDDEKGWNMIVEAGTGHYQNIELNAAPNGNRWLPASIFNGFGGSFRQHHNKKHSLFFTDLCLVFKHTNSASYRLTSDGRLNDKKEIKDIFYRFSTTAYIDEIRAWGNDWLFYGVIIRVTNGSGSGKDQSELSVRNFRVYTKQDNKQNNNRLIPPAPRPDSERGNPAKFS